MKDRIEVKTCFFFFFIDYYNFGRKNSEMRDRIEVKTFFFRDHDNFGRKNSKMRDRIKVKTFFFSLWPEEVQEI